MPKVPYIFFATTNGTLVHGYIQDWLWEHRAKFYCCLSIDGTKQMHDVNRSESFNAIDVDFFIKAWPDQPVKMTISTKTLPYLFEGFLFLHSKGFKVECNLSEGVQQANTLFYETLHRELTKLAMYLIQNNSAHIPQILNVDFKALHATKRKKWCGAGEETMVCIDTDGKRYPCQMFTPLSAGKLSQTKAQINLAEERLHDMLCSDCVIESICKTCYGANYLRTGNPAKRDPIMCKVMKICVVVSAFFNAKKLEKFLSISNLTESEARLIYLQISGIKKFLESGICKEK
jgi:radical SAM protein with 4Fe4S-binding SPASM domain